MFSQFKFLIVVSLLVWVMFSASQAKALTPAEVNAAAAATDAVPVAVDIVNELKGTVSKAFEIVRLPVGVVQIGLCPLPGITFLDGLHNVIQGGLVPLKVVGDVIRIGFEGVGRLFSGLSSH